MFLQRVDVQTIDGLASVVGGSELRYAPVEEEHIELAERAAGTLEQRRDGAFVDETLGRC